VDSFICQTTFTSSTQIKTATFTVLDINAKSSQLPFKVPMGATPAGSYNAFLDTKLGGTSDWTLAASINNCFNYYCTFECDVTRVLTNKDAYDVQLPV
jgi:hypothetical protein